MNIGWAIQMMKDGHCISREGYENSVSFHIKDGKIISREGQECNILSFCSENLLASDWIVIQRTICFRNLPINSKFRWEKDSKVIYRKVDTNIPEAYLQITNCLGEPHLFIHTVVGLNNKFVIPV